MRIDLNISYGSDAADGTSSRSGNLGGSGYCHAGGETEVSSAENVDLDSSVDATEAEEDTDVATGDISLGSESQQGTDVATNSLEALRNNAESLINVGCVFATLAAVLKAYSRYGKLIGFSVRKGSQAYFVGTKHVCSKVYFCSCAGAPDNKCSNGILASFKKQSHRTNCPARLRVGRVDVASPWIVTLLVKHHNHEMLNPSHSYLLRSARKMQESHRNFLTGMKFSGIGVNCAYRFLEKEAGSRANIGFTRKDVYNELNRNTRNICKVPNADVNRMLEFFTEKGMSDPSFYWRVKVGEDGRLQNLFFRDTTRCLVDYQHFGDVVSVDATYKTNKYDLICVPIVGINHHRTNVMFAVAFLSNERNESYAWLFDTFLDSMYGKEPSIIFSDQDQALMNGLDHTFRQASHRLCQWHINKNAVKQFGKLNHDNRFKSLWYQCMSGCESEEEFESTWISLIVEYNLSENRWFSTMYNLRKRWSSAFTRDKFSGGLHATSRSEVTNKVIKELCKSTSSVYDFVIGFESVLKSWRVTESEEDALCRGIPGMLVQQTGILVQVAKVCTRKIFKSFEYESLNSISVRMTHEPPDLNDEVLVFKVFSKTSVTGSRTVTFNQSTNFARCTCHMWETEGIMCRRLFLVYFHLNLEFVPDEMLMKRWRRDSKERIGLTSDASDCAGTNEFNNMIFVNHCAKRVYDLLAEFKDDSICRSAIEEHISNMEEAVHKLRNVARSGPKDGQSQKSFQERLHRAIKNPICKRKSRRRRKMFSKYWAARDSEANQSSCNFGVQEGLQHDGVMGSQMAGTQGEYEGLPDDADRFSVD